MWFFTSKKKSIKTIIAEKETKIQEAHQAYMGELEAARQSALKVNKALEGVVARDLARAFGGRMGRKNGGGI